MRKALGILAPKTRTDMVWKTLLFCGLISCWHLVWSFFIRSSNDHSVAEVILEALVVGGPFAALFVIGSWHQVTAIRSLTDRARIDPLSGVYNRQTFFSRTRRAVTRTRTGLLLLIDVDHFKKINDQFGHAVGDRCISAIGHRLNWHLRESDLAGRIGGEEFAIFLADVSKEHGRHVATRIGQPIEFPDPSGTGHLSATFSVGAVWTNPEIPIEDQLMLADEALYQAKTTGRKRLIFIGEEGHIPLSAKGRADVMVSSKREKRRTSRLEFMSSERE